MGMPRATKLLEPRHWQLLGLLGATSFFDGYDRNIVIVALPQLRASFHLSQSSASLWISLLYMGALPALFLARRADVVGRRRLLMITVSGFTVATAATSVAPTILSFALCQFAAQAFLTAETAVVWTMVAEELPAGARGVGFGWLALLNALGTGLCALIYATALLPQSVSWRWLYVGTIPVLIAVIFLRRRLPESRRFSVASAKGLINAHWRRIVQPPIRRRLALAAAAALLAALTQQSIVFVVDFMETQRHQSASTANLILVAAGAFALPALLIAGALSDRLGRRPVACGFLVLSAVGPIWLFLFAHGALSLLAALGLTYVGNFGAWPTLGAFGSELFPTSSRALAGSMVAGSQISGQSLSFVLAAVLIPITRSLGHTSVLLTIGPLLAAVVVSRLPETKGKELEELAPDPELVPPLAVQGY